MTTLFKNRFACLVSACLLLVAGPLALAQEGHPFKGTWRGTIDRGGEQTGLVMIIDYDGEQLTGMINPGRNSYRFQDVSHDAPNWRLQVKAETRQGEPVEFDGVLNEIGSVNRYLEGTWTQGGQRYPFRITRE